MFVESSATNWNPSRRTCNGKQTFVLREVEKIDVFLVEYVIFQSCSSSGEARRDIEIPRD
jgi:hypothetical protein